MKISLEKPGSPAEVLEHHGTKGMKWGVRNAYLVKAGNRAARERRVSEGKGSVTDKVRVGARISGVQLIKGRGFKGAARNKAIKDEQHIKRITTGKATVKDQLKEIGGISMLNVIDLHKGAVAARKSR